MFDIDHLYLQRLNFKVGEDDKVIENAYDASQKEFYQNKLLNTMMVLLLDTDNSMHLLFKSIDNDTTLAQDCAKAMRKDNSTANQAYNFNTLSEQVGRKNTFISGKFGIGPYALNLTMQTLLEQFNMDLKPSSIPAKIGRSKIGNHFTDEGDTTLAWLSAFINGNVDNVKDPWVARLNSNNTTFNMINFLLKLGYGKQAVWFCAQPILKKYAEFLSVKNCKLLQDPLNFLSQDVMLDKFLKDNIGMSLELVRALVKSIRKNGSNLIKNTLDNVLLKSAATENGALSEKETKDLLKNVMLTWFALESSAELLSRLIQFSKIDTRKEGKTFSQLTAYKYGYQALYNDNYDLSMTFNQKTANSLLMYNDEDLAKLREGTWIGPKTRSVLNSIFKAMSKLMFVANNNFRSKIIKMAEMLYPNCKYTGKLSANLIDDLTTGAISLIKWQWSARRALNLLESTFDNYDLNQLFIGDNSVARMLDEINSKIANNEEYSSNGKKRNWNEFKDNELLNRLRRNYDLSSDNQNAPQFVVLTRAFDDSKLDTDRLIEDWEQLLQSDNDYVRLFANMLVAYAMLTSCEYQGKNKLAKYIPSKFLSGELYDSKVDGVSFAEYILSRLNNDNFEDLNINSIVSNLINNRNFVKRRNIKDFDLFYDKRNDTSILITKDKYKENPAPRYVSVKSDLLSADGRITNDLYLLFNYNDKDQAVYIKISELGYHNKGFDIFDYNQYGNPIVNDAIGNDEFDSTEQEDTNLNQDEATDMKTDESNISDNTNLNVDNVAQQHVEIYEDGFIQFEDYGPKFRLSTDKKVVEYTNIGNVVIHGDNNKSISMSASNFLKFVDIVEKWFDGESLYSKDGTNKSIKYNKDLNYNVNSIIDDIGGYDGRNAYYAKNDVAKYNKQTHSVNISNINMYNLYKFAESGLFDKINKLDITNINGYPGASIADKLYSILNNVGVDKSDVESVKSLETCNDLFGENDVDLLAKEFGIDKQTLMQALEEGAKKRKNCKGK